MRVRDILRNKGRAVFRISVEASMSEVVAALVRHNCGALVVCDANGVMNGIISERDVLRTCADQSVTLAKEPVQARMTREVVTGTLDQSLDDVLSLMTKRRIRHLPILEDNQLAGLISIGDAVKARQDALLAENHHLLNYINQ